jgi:hypothetical protein
MAGHEKPGLEPGATLGLGVTAQQTSEQRMRLAHGAGRGALKLPTLPAASIAWIR